jgi:GNAT superfamily N-acetyltransferase
VTCFVVRAGFRGRGITYPLAAATIDQARSHGARALEAYPMDPAPGAEVTWGEINVGHVKVFLAAGFGIVHRPSKRRVVMRIDLADRP